MQLNLVRPICIFDLETTGVNVTNDRIVEICIHKVNPSGEEETYTWRVNPTIPIPTGSSLVHRIYDHDIANEPTFQEIAPEIHQLISDSDLVELSAQVKNSARNCKSQFDGVVYIARPNFGTKR